ncbi:MAG: hypothetical protein ACE5DL_02765 [Nitrosopumilaceae archaeon]
MVLSEKTLDEILNYLDTSLSNLTQESTNSPEFQLDAKTLNDFLSSQYDIRLSNLLQRKNSDIHYLESGMKNKIIQRKQKRINELLKIFSN